MANSIGPPARELRDVIVVQRRLTTVSPIGGTAGAWSTIVRPHRVKLNPMTPRRGSEETVIAARLQGMSLWDCWIRFDGQTAGILQQDRVCDVRAGLDANGDYLRTFNIRFAEDLEGRNLWFLLQLEAGAADG